MSKLSGLCVPKKYAEKAIMRVKELKLHNIDFKIKGTKSGYVILPLVRKPSKDEFNILNTNIQCMKLLTSFFFRNTTIKECKRCSER